MYGFRIKLCAFLCNTFNLEIPSIYTTLEPYHETNESDSYVNDHKTNTIFFSYELTVLRIFIKFYTIIIEVTSD